MITLVMMLEVAEPLSALSAVNAPPMELSAKNGSMDLSLARNTTPAQAHPPHRKRNAKAVTLAEDAIRLSA